MITAETIRVFECEDWDILYEENSNSVLSKQSDIEVQEKEKIIIEYKNFEEFFNKLESENENGGSNVESDKTKEINMEEEHLKSMFCC